MPELGAYKKHIAICPYCHRIVKAGRLTYQQWEVTKRLIGGESTTAIADALFVSVKTVEAHRHKIFEVLGVRNISLLIRWANDNGFLSLMGWDDTRSLPGSEPGSIAVSPSESSSSKDGG